MENLLFLGVPILKHIRVIPKQKKKKKKKEKIKNRQTKHLFVHQQFTSTFNSSNNIDCAHKLAWNAVSHVFFEERLSHADKSNHV